MADQTQLLIEERLRLAAEAIEPPRQFSEDLWDQIAQTEVKRSQPERFWSALFARPAWAVAAAVIVVLLGVALAGPQRTAAAFRSLLGYLPGIGFVQDETGTLYLASPVTVEQGGVTLTVEQAVADANNTIVAYHIDGLSAPAPGEAGCFYDLNRLQVAGGRELHPTGGGVTNNEARVEFAPLPAGVTQATLHVGMLPPEPACPAEWTVTLDFGPVPPEVELLPVLDSPVLGSPAGQAANTPAESTTAATLPGEVRILLDQTVALEDGYLVTGHVEWQDKTWENVGLTSDAVQAVDAAGKPVPIGPAEVDSENNTFAFEVQSRDFTPPLALTVEYVMVWARPPEGSPERQAFSFEAGPDPQTGQTWPMDHPLQGVGQTVIVHQVQAVTGDTDQAGTVEGYAFEVEAGPQVSWLNLDCRGQEPVEGVWGQGRPDGESGQILELYYPSGRPSGLVTCQVLDWQARLEGSWQLEWQPPQ